MISYEDFKKVELKVAKVISAEKVPETDKLIMLKLRVGEEERQIVSGIAQYYSPEQLEGREIIIVANLEPKVFRGIESQGMLLATRAEDESIVLLTLDKEVPSGSQIN